MQDGSFARAVEAVAVAERRAALLLHAAGDADRRWLLARLDTPQQTRLQALLQELRQLRLARDPSLLQAVLDRPAITDSSASPPQDSRAVLQAADTATLVRLLRREPAMLLVHLLSLHPWPWRDALLAQLATCSAAGAAARAWLSRHPMPAPLPPALARSLIDTLAQAVLRIGRETELAPAPARPRRWWPAGRRSVSRREHA
ncbi:hypothetical protein [Xylophilus rhododendri]|nr:hypothetical protein [Xylophilus rhododendri]